jgi:hypothetical protein
VDRRTDTQIESFHHILNDLELVVHHRNVPEVVAHPVGDAHPLLIEDVEMPPLHRIDVDVTNYWGACARAFFRPQLPRFPPPSTGRAKSLPQGEPPEHAMPYRAPATVQRIVPVSSIGIILQPFSPTFH